MKRFHVHVAVDDLAASTKFYATLFGSPPSVVKDDYVKWMLDDPRLNFAISSRGNSVGVNHLGFQADSAEELDQIHQRLQGADAAIVAEDAASCCYAKSDKYWVTDPSGIAWESFHTLESIPTFGGAADPSSAHTSQAAGAAASGCCAPAPQAIQLTKPANPSKGACCG